MVDSDVPYGRLTDMNVKSALPEQLPVIVSSLGIQKREEIRKKLRRLAGMEIALGSISIVLGIVILAMNFALSDPRYGSYSIMASGVWCGAFLLVTGILGVKVDKNPSLKLYNANLVLSILSANAMAVVLCFSGMGAAAYGFSSATVFPFANLVVLIVLSSLLALIGLVGMIISIVHSAYCCKGVCCLHSEPPTVIVQGEGAPYQTQQMVQLADGRFVLVPAQSSPAYANEIPVSPSGSGFSAPL